jgi:hypothetical protein
VHGPVPGEVAHCDGAAGDVEQPAGEVGVRHAAARVGGEQPHAALARVEDRAERDPEPLGRQREGSVAIWAGSALGLTLGTAIATIVWSK